MQLGLTFKDIEKSQKINCGQLSRFEAGQFKRNSRNLQKLCKFLQIRDVAVEGVEEGLGYRLERFAARSPQHHAAVKNILSALESLD